MNPILKRLEHVNALRSGPFDKFWSALQEYRQWIAALRVQPVSGVWLCSWYTNTDDWGLWVSLYDPGVI